MLILAMMLQTAVAQNGQIYLKCALQGDSPMDVQLNEANGTATYSFVIGGTLRSYTVRAAFTADRVVFNSFSVSRSDLSFARDNSFLAGLTNRALVDRGQCERITTKQAF